MLTHSKENLLDLLLDYLDLQEKIISYDELYNRLAKINSIQDLIQIDRNTKDPLWQVVPQIALYKFQLDGFKMLTCSHAINQSFVFIHPLHLEIINRLKEELSYLVSIGREVDIVLTKQVISVLYGGYQWHEPYVKACEYFGSIGSPAKVIVLDSIDNDKLNSVIDYKNINREILAQRKVIGKEVLKTNMNGIINSFHSPDQIENTRQMIGLGLFDINEISNA